jgi:hypothetical protein
MKLEHIEAQAQGPGASVVNYVFRAVAVAEQLEAGWM